MSCRDRSALFLILSAYAERLCATLRRFNRTALRQIIPITATFLNLCTRSPPFKVHSLPPGRLPSSRCIRSARPRIIRLPTVPRWALQIQHYDFWGLISPQHFDDMPTLRPSRFPDTGTFNWANDPRAIRALVDECFGLKSTVEPRVTYPERRLFGRAASSLF